MTVKELYTAFTGKIPVSLSEIWDNDGLSVCADPTREVRRVLIALDLSDAVARYATKTHADVIVTHHPLIFRPLSALTTDDPIARRALHLVRKGISAMSFHTRFDRFRAASTIPWRKSSAFPMYACLEKGKPLSDASERFLRK